MKINKAQLLADLKSDLKASEPTKKAWDAKRSDYIKQWKGEPYGNEVKGRSAIVSNDVRKQSEWQHASIVDPFVSTADVVKCHPVTWEDAEAAKQNELLLNTQFCRKFNRFNFMTKAVKVLDMEGTVVVQTGWDYEDKEVTTVAEVVMVDALGNEYIGQQEVTETIVLRNQPTARVCRNEDIYIDPTCQDDMDKCQFVIHRYETDLSTLRKDGRYKNLDQVARGISGVSSNDYDYRPEDDTQFTFKDDPRKKLVVYEYWGNYDVNGDGIAEAIVCAWVNDVIIRLQDNPYPDKKPPFLVVPFNSVPFQMYGEANAELIGDNQKIKTAIYRGIIDNMAQSNNGQLGVRKGALDALNRKKFEQGKPFEFNGTPSDFWHGSYNQIPGSAFDMIGIMNNEIESLTGVKSFSGGISGSSIGGTATAARGALDAASTRRLNIVRNIAENLVKPLLRKWMAYNAEFLEAEEVIRITNEEFVPVRRDDLSGHIDIDISISTAEDNAAKSQELSFLLQTLGNNLPFEITQHLMSDILELMRMPDKANALRNYQPEPDPFEEQMKQLELAKLQAEVEKLKSEVTRNIATAQEDEADKVVKLAKAKRDDAYARKLLEEADLTSLKFLKEDEDMDHKHKVELANIKRLANLDSIAAQASLGDTNIGVLR